MHGKTYITEIARQVMKEKGYTRKDVGNVQMQLDIMERHLEQEEEGLASERPVILCDRSAIDPVVYAKLTSRNGDQSGLLVNNSTFQRALKRYRKPTSIIILLTPVKEWIVDDGIRSLEHQEECLRLFRDLLKAFKIPYREISHDMKFLDERVVFTLGLGRF